MPLTTDLFDEYIRKCLAYPGIRGRGTIVTLVAIGAAETGLDNSKIGDNAKNGTPLGSTIKQNGQPLIDPWTNAPIDTHYSLGYGWLQHDSGWLRADQIINGVNYTIEAIRKDPMYSLDLIIRRPGFVLHQGANQTYIDFKKWAVYPKKSDEFMDDAEEAYSRVKAS